jgi:hypothetical protein
LRRFAGAAVCALVPLLLPAVAVGAEMLGLNTPDQFKVGHQDQDGRMRIVELVEPPETVENWTRLVTALSLFGVVQKVSVGEFETNWRGGLKNDCPRAVSKVVSGSVDGRPARRSEVSCPFLSKTGRPEVLTAFIVQGEADLFMVQVAFGREPDDADRALVAHVGRSLKVCREDALDACKARQAVGFVASE